VSVGGTAGATTAVVTQIAPNDGTTYDVAVSGMSADGTVIASIPAGVATDAVGNPNTASTSTDNTVTWQMQAATSLLYNGPQIVNAGDSFQPAARLSSPRAACVSGQPISFTLDRDPTNGAAGPYALGTATTNSSGQATLAAISTTGWQEGIYDLTATFSGTASCLASSDEATLTVASPGESATGGGWYTLSGSGRLNFGFTVRKVDASCQSDCAYKGQLLLINNGKWRLKGTLDTYSKLATGQGAASGTGDLQWWDSSLNGGLGDWALAQSGVSFTANFYDSGKNGKASTDTFGIRIAYTPVAPQPGTLPNSTPQLLKGGDIKVQ
jgi:hypothetical protein